MFLQFQNFIHAMDSDITSNMV